MLNMLQVQNILTGLRIAYFARMDPFEIMENPNLEC